jgi:hypothetical protein
VISGVAQRERRHSVFLPDALVVVKVEVKISEMLSLLQSFGQVGKR